MEREAIQIRPLKGTYLFVSTSSKRPDRLMIMPLKENESEQIPGVLNGIFRVKGRTGLFRLRMSSLEKSQAVIFRSNGWFDIFWDDNDIVAVPKP